AEIETDKATMEVEAVDEGKIGKILVAEGTDNVKVNAVIAILLQEGESLDAAAPKAAPAAVAEAPKAEAPKPAAAAPAPQAAAAAPKPASAPAAKAKGSKVFASPLARRLAKEAGIDVAAISGSGPKGRVVKADVDAAKSGKTPLKA